MLPLGSQNSGGRSSNLSPLAPPFTLDKPYHKQHNSNPPLIFIDQPYAPRFDRPGPPIEPVWNPPVNPTFGPSFPENSSNDGSFAPMDAHGFPGSQPNNSSSSSTRLVPLNSAASNGYDGFQYGQFSSSAPTSLAEAKPYYPPYVVADDRESAARKEPSYDLLSNFGVSQLGGSSQVDDTRTVPRVEYTPQWSGLWNGLNDVEQGNWLDLGGNYGSKDCKPSESSIGPKCTRKGSDAGGDRYNFHTGTLLPVGSLGSYAETSIKKTNCFDGFGGENKFGSTSIEDRTSFKEPNPGPTIVSGIKMSALESTTAGNDSHHFHDPFWQDPLGNFGYYEGLVDSRDKHANYSDSYVCDSTSTVRSSPAHWSSFCQFPSTQYAAPSTTVNAVSNESVDKTENTSDFLPYHPFGLNFQVSNFTGNTDSLFTGSSSTKLEDHVNKKQVNDDCFDQLLKTKSSSLIPHLSVAEFAKIKSDNAETFSTEKFSDGPDIQNPAEDSPCWKGARFSPFEDSKVVTPDSVLEKTEPCFDPDIEEHKNNHTGLNAVHISERSSNSNYASRERDGSCSMTQGSLKLCGTDGFQPTDEKHGMDREIGSELSFFNYSGIAYSSRNPLVLQLNSEGCVYMPEEKSEPSVAETVAEMNGKYVDAHSSNVLSYSPTNSGDHLVRSPSGNVSASITGQLSGKDSNSKVDISVLVTTLENLSEVLVSHCSNSHDAPTELDGAALKHIISNLNSCLVKKADQSIETEKSQDPQQDKSYTDAALQVSKFTMARMDQPHQHGLDTFSGCKGDILCNGNQGISDSSSLKDNAESIRDADTIEAIKRVLDMNFPSEEMQPETVLYKNLWLEAEAALCASTARARFNRIKIETGNRDSHRTDDEENVQISNASDVNKVAEAPPHEANYSPSSSKHSCQVDMESSVIARFRTLTSVVEDLKATKPVGGLDTATIHIPTYVCSSGPQSQTSDIEASVMARFKTFQSRADNSDLLNTEGGKSPSKANFGPPSPDHYSYFSAMANPNDSPGAAVMSRFNILKARIEQSESLDMDTQQLQGPSLTSLFSAENRFSVHPEGENVEDCSGTSMSSNTGKPPRRGIGLGDELLEGWYDCSELGWEHVTKDGSPKQN